MFPIRDTIRSRSFPFINWMIIILNTLIFLFQSNLSQSALDSFINTFALIPARIDPGSPLTWYPILTHFWLHSSLLHLVSNMWILFIFGDNVEDRLGSFRYLIFYLLGGICAGSLQYFFSVGTEIPALGASGAIASVMGAYFLFFPRSKVVTFIPILLFVWFVNISSYVYLGIWFLIQVLSGLASLQSPASASMGGVAWWAHIGGFLFGLLMAKPFCIGRCHRQDYSDEYYPW